MKLEPPPQLVSLTDLPFRGPWPPPPPLSRILGSAPVLWWHFEIPKLFIHLFQTTDVRLRCHLSQFPSENISTSVCDIILNFKKKIISERLFLLGWSLSPCLPSCLWPFHQNHLWIIHGFRMKPKSMRNYRAEVTPRRNLFDEFMAPIEICVKPDPRVNPPGCWSLARNAPQIHR